MREMIKKLGKIGFILFVLFFSFENIFALETTSFIVVLDAGHGGKDPGAVNGKWYEKDINLAIVLALGDLIEKNNKDVKVFYTRKKDTYLTLQERADVANNAHADLFISIHTNANNNSEASGTETYTLGLTKSQSNLDVAMRENSVILLEDDYKVKYAGFNPNSPDSYIMFECIQNTFLDKSVQIASDVQKRFADTGRKDRGVRQAGFWVLHKTAMPSILVEVGYISNKEERNFLFSDDGRLQLSTAIYESFDKFKKEYERKSGKQNYVSTTPEDLASTSNKLTEKEEVKEVVEKKVEEKTEIKEEKPVVKEETVAVVSKEMTKDEEMQTQQFLDKMKAEANIKEEKPVEKKEVIATTVKAEVKTKPTKVETKPATVAPVTATQKPAVTTTPPKVEVKPQTAKVETKPATVAPVTAIQKPAVSTTPPKVEVKPQTAKVETKPATIATTTTTTKPSVSSSSKTATKQAQASTNAVVYKLQLFALKNRKPTNDPAFKGLEVDFYEEAGLIKYTYGYSRDYQQIQALKKEIATKFPGAIVIAFKDGKKVPVEETIMK